MIRHLLHVTWSRRRARGLLLAEMLLAFLVLCAVSLLAAATADRLLQPVGFDHRDVWEVAAYQEGDLETAATMDQVRQALVDLDEVVAVGVVDWCSLPYGDVSCGSTAVLDGHSVRALRGDASDPIAEVLKITVTQGRWFEAADDALAWRPVIINESLRRELFGAADPLGRSFKLGDTEEELRVVGIVDDYRNLGELEPPEHFVLRRVGRGESPWVMSPNRPQSRIFLLRTRPGTPASFEDRLQRQLAQRARGVRVEIHSLSRRRDASMMVRRVMLAVAGSIAGFLLLMVGLGLMGVLWQSVTQRTRELGLRRAVGATARGVRAQILGELLVLTTIAVGVGMVLVVQLRVLEVFATLSTAVCAAALAASLAVMYSLVLACGLYPSWLATRVRPAQALHYD